MEYFKTPDDTLELIVSDGKKIFKAHNHTKHFIISLVEKGSAKVFCNQQNSKQITERAYFAGDFFAIFPMQAHKVELEEFSKMISLSINKELIENNSKENLSKIIFDFLEKQNLHAFTKKQKNQIAGAIEAFAHIKKTYNNNSSKENKFENLISNLIDFPENDFLLEDVAQQSFSSKFHFARNFKNTVGLSLHQFLIQNRIRKSQKLIADGMKISHAAQETGFYDQSHFDKYFKIVVGIPPKEYSQKIRLNLN